MPESSTQSGQHLLSLVNTILDMSKIETGNFEIQPEPFDLGGLIDFCIDVVKLKAAEKNIALTRACLPQLGDIVADKRACKQILLNLLSNAIKFTQEGGSVSVQVRADGAFIEIAVSDTGIGVTPADSPGSAIPSSRRARPMTAPMRAPASASRSCAALSACTAGPSSFESAPGEGACATVRLPLDCRDGRKIAGHHVKIETMAQRGRPLAAPDRARPNDQVKKIA